MILWFQNIALRCRRIESSNQLFRPDAHDANMRVTRLTARNQYSWLLSISQTHSSVYVLGIIQLMAFLRGGSLFCILEAALTYYPERYILGGIYLVTTSAGIIGAALQLRSLRQFKNRQRRRPSPNRNIVFCSVFSDLIACAGLYFAFFLYLYQV